jgi:hypothetical protein
MSDDSIHEELLEKRNTDPAETLEPSAALRAEALDRSWDRRETAALESVERRRPDQVEAFERDHLVQIAEENGKYVYSLAANGEREILFTTECTEAGLKSAEKLLRTKVQEKVSQLESDADLKVHFSKDGEWVGKIRVRGTPGNDGLIDVYARAPHLAELYGIEAALQHAQPSQLNAASNDGTKFYFVHAAYPKGFGVFAYLDKDKDGNPAVFFQPGTADGRPVTERDRAPGSSLTSSLDPKASIESLVTHELGHNHQSKQQWDDPAIEKRMAGEMGWTSYSDGKSGENRWLLRAANKDANGENQLYSYTGQWVLSNKDGQPISADGRLLNAGEPQIKLTTDEMQNAALVRPSTKYFINPIEMYAEGLMSLRLGNDSRRQLLSSSPVLYELVKRQDQIEIDTAYGAGQRLRSTDGSLVESSAANRHSLSEFEKRFGS